MELDLRGQTVTQAIVMTRQALADCEADELLLKTDSEVVKLNLYNALIKMGHRCRLERKGPFFTITVAASKGAARAKTPPESKDGSVVRQEITAFPARNLGADEISQARRQRRSERRRGAEPEQAPAAGVARPAQAPSPAPKPAVPPEVKRTAPEAESEAGTNPSPLPNALQGRDGAMMSWLILQQEQIGARDSKLGFDLLADFLESLEPTRFAGIFLIHRAARLCDPQFQQGRFLKILRARRIHLWVCSKSLAYYEIESLPAPLQRAQIIDIQRLASLYRLVWV